MKRLSAAISARRLADALTIAEQQGLLKDGRMIIARVRMPLPLVEQARKRSGIESYSKLIEAALALIAVAEDYSQRGTFGENLDLEF